MVSKRSELVVKEPKNEILDPPTTMNIVDNLMSTLKSPERINSQLLKSSYYLLFASSSKQQLSLGKGADLNELFVKINEDEVRVSLRDLYTLSKILFENLQRRLKQLQSLKHDISANQSLELEEVNLSIRCCMAALTFCVPQERLLESGRVLLLLFKKLSLLEVQGRCHGNADYKKLVCCQCMYGGEELSDSFAEVASLSSLEIFDSCISSIKAILEVLISELLVHERLRKYLQIINSLSPINERLFKHGTTNGYFGVTMELIYSHFSLSICDEVALEEFLNSITWFHSKSSELSLIATKSLLQNPVILSSPKLFQAHIVSMLSNLINVNVNIEKPTPDCKLFESYLSVFESSVILYTQNMSILKTQNHTIDATGTSVNRHKQRSHLSLESCIDPRVREKLQLKITTLNESWNSNLRRKFIMKKDDLVTSGIEYIQQSLCIIDVEYQDDVFLFLKGILTRAVNEVNEIEFPFNGENSLQDICLLASLLMLMSNSLIQSVSCIKKQKHQKEYNSIIGIINGFKEFNIHLPIQKNASNMMETSSSHKELKLMLIHFLGLLSLSFDSGFDVLVKSCVWVIMALTNLFVLEEGNIDALRSLSLPLSSEGALVVYKKPMVFENSTLAVATSFQKIRSLYLSNCSAYTLSEEDVEVEKLSSGTLVPLNVDTRETCSGDTYLKSRLEGSQKVEDFDDLADFVECKKGKDYVGWLKNRDKFREKKLGRHVKRRWEKKKKACRDLFAKVT